MKISFELDANNSVWELLDGFTVVMLKQVKVDAEKELSAEWIHEEDERLAKKRIKATKVLLDYYGVKDE